MCLVCPCLQLVKMLYAVAALTASAVAFAPPATLHQASAVRTAGPVMMDTPALTRRDVFSVAAAAAAFAPLAANADGASSPAVLARARAIYGSRVYRLQSASPAVVLEEKNMLTLFRTGAYRSAADKDTTKKLASLEKSIVAAAKSGDAAKTSAGLKEFVTVCCSHSRSISLHPRARFC